MDTCDMSLRAYMEDTPIPDIQCVLTVKCVSLSSGLLNDNHSNGHCSVGTLQFEACTAVCSKGHFRLLNFFFVFVLLVSIKKNGYCATN